MRTLALVATIIGMGVAHAQSIRPQEDYISGVVASGEPDFHPDIERAGSRHGIIGVLFGVAPEVSVFAGGQS
jgi:hypothetical protein